jgi:polar amino acid transport system permease protein
MRRARLRARRLLGLALCGLLAGLAALLGWRLAAGFDSGLIEDYGPELLAGLRLTVIIVGASLAAGLLLALPITAIRYASRGLAGRAAAAYCLLFRGTPLLAQLYLVYYGAGELRPQLQAIGLWWLLREPLPCVLLTFTLNTAAYQAEILLGALRAVPSAQYEAARALALPPLALWGRVVLPQAMLLALRPLGNEVAKMFKASAVASVVTVLDLMGATNLIYARSFQFDIYLVAALVYLACVEGLRQGVEAVERRLLAHRGAPPPGLLRRPRPASAAPAPRR